MRNRMAIALVLVAFGGIAFAGPFFRCRGGSCRAQATSYVRQSLEDPRPPRPETTPETKEFPESFPTGIVALQESQTEPIIAPQPWLEPELMEPRFSPVQDTALEPLPGTGSKLPIGGSSKLPDLLKQLDILKKQLEGVQGIGNAQKPQVDINLPLPDGTSQQLSRVLTLVEGVLWLLGMLGGSSLAGKLLPLVARMVSGLQSSAMATSSASLKTPVGTSAIPTNSSSGGNPVGV